MVQKTRCPNCAKIGRDKHGDNLVTYSDGGQHCFSCGYHTNTTTSPRPLKAPLTNNQDLTLTTLLPHDTNTTIPLKCLLWLKQYFITYKDIINNGICWSESRQLLIFPYDNCWQGRYFGTDPTHPKWFSKGLLDDILWGKDLESASTKGIILCEDIISILRVGKHYPSLCLFGSSISRRKLGRILTFVSDKLIWWLDYDKKDETIRNVLYLQQIGFDSQAIITKNDPKCYSDKEIIQILLDNNVSL